jgi:3-deoxy-D-manno-octulosonic-acid transferase
MPAGVAAAENGRALMLSWRQQFARRAYSALLTLLLPGYLLRLWLRGRAEALYRHHLGERLGRYDTPAAHGWVWLHAVSLGETRAAAALIDALRRERPAMRLLLTHGTATGREAGSSLLRDGDRQVWLPYDTAAATRRFIAQFRPCVGVLMETEVWPNLLHAAHEVEVPMVLANARLSERSHLRGQRLRALILPAAERITLVLAQTEADAHRLRANGAKTVEVCGNLKFDMSPDETQLAQGRRWRTVSDRPIVLAASTREGEELSLLSGWSANADEQPQSRLLIVPRHPQRFDEVAALVVQAGMKLDRRSRWGDAPDTEALGADVWLGDSMGEMALYYAACDVALLGGSFAPLGGQNLIEAAACGAPVVMGPHTFNFAQAAELSIAAGAAVRVSGIDEGVRTARALTQRVRRESMARQALAFAAEHRGAAQRMAERIVAIGMTTSAAH